jgi:N-acetylglutamate synthase
LFGARKPGSGAESGLPPAALPVLSGGAPTFAEVRGPSGDLAAIGRSAVVDGHLGVFAVEVTPPYRRTGLARHVVAALAGHAADAAHTAYLQVEETNAAARGLYDRLGFRPHHSYRYRRAAQ